MTDLRTAAQQALEAIDWLRLHLQRDHQCLHMDPAKSGIPAWINKSETNLRAALAEPVQEPVHEHEKWCASVTQLLLCDPPRKAPCNCKKKVAEPVQEPPQDHFRDVTKKVQEPVAWAVYDIKHGGSKTLHWPEQHSPNGDPEQFKAVPLYSAPPQRKPLKEEEIADAANSVRWSEQYHVDFARAVERAHGIGV